MSARTTGPGVDAGHSAASPTTRHDVVVIGGGPAGLVTSRRLTERAIDHVVLERGRLVERWRSERWDSLRLLTPNWQTRLPGWRYEGDNPHGYMTMPEVVDYLNGYAKSFDAPIAELAEVTSVSPIDGGFLVKTRDRTYAADAVVIATGAVPSVPDWHKALSPSVHQVHSSRYRNPGGLPEGGVVVVGASASGIQLADELRATGRAVILSVGEHVRLPRTYRGRDIHWWLDVAGTLDVGIEHVADLERARRSPSLQLVGTPEQRTLDLNRLVAAGVEIVGRSRGGAGWTLWFERDLEPTTLRADQRMYRILDLFDQVATAAVLDERLEPPYRPAPTRVPESAAMIDIEQRGITTMLWATGFRSSYPWLRVPVLDHRGAIRHHGGVTDWPGLYAMGLPFMRRRKSTFLDGFGDDAEDIVRHLAGHLARAGTRRAGGGPHHD